jgi:hypothetical protein
MSKLNKPITIAPTPTKLEKVLYYENLKEDQRMNKILDQLLKKK